MPFCTSMAQRTASTTLRNSTSAPSPVRLMTRPLCTAMVGSIRSLRSARNLARVRSSSSLASRLYPTTSAARIAASLRFSLIEPSLISTIAGRQRQGELLLGAISAEIKSAVPIVIDALEDEGVRDRCKNMQRRVFRDGAKRAGVRRHLDMMGLGHRRDLLHLR